MATYHKNSKCQDSVQLICKIDTFTFSLDRTKSPSIFWNVDASELDKSLENIVGHVNISVSKKYIGDWNHK